MGEKQRIEITFGEGADEVLAKALAGLLTTQPTIVVTDAPQPASRNPYDIGLEPWAFHDPAQKCDVVAYIDDRNQVRHVPASRSSEVPKAWRRVWLEDRR